MTALFVVYISLGKPQRTNQRYLPIAVIYCDFIHVFIPSLGEPQRSNKLAWDAMQLRYFCFAGQFATGHQNITKSIAGCFGCGVIFHMIWIAKKRCASYTGFFEKHFLNKQN